MAEMNFDSTGVDTSSHFDVIPEGQYEVIITESDRMPTKDGGGEYLHLRMEIQSGQHAGRILFDRLNMKNANPKAVEIGQRMLAQICHATGVLQLSDSQQVHNIPIIAIVKIRAAKPPYDESNEVKGYKAVGKGAATTATENSAPRKAPVAAPWAK